MDIEKAAEALKKIRSHQKRRAKSYEAMIANFHDRWNAKFDKTLGALDAETRAAVQKQLAQERQKDAQAALPPWASEEPPPVEAVTVERRGKK